MRRAVKPWPCPATPRSHSSDAVSSSRGASQLPGSHGTVRNNLSLHGSCCPGHLTAGDPGDLGPVGEEARSLLHGLFHASCALSRPPQPFVFLAQPAQQVGVDARRGGGGPYSTDLYHQPASHNPPHPGKPKQATRRSPNGMLRPTPNRQNLPSNIASGSQLRSPSSYARRHHRIWPGPGTTAATAGDSGQGPANPICRPLSAMPPTPQRTICAHRLTYAYCFSRHS